MPSPEFYAHLLEENRSDTLLILLTVEHADLVSALRFVNSKVNITSRGSEYIAAGFAFYPPEVGGRGQARATLRVANVDRVIWEAIDALDTAATLTVELVLASAPDDVEITWPTLKLSSVDADRRELVGELALQGGDDEPACAASYSNNAFPALF